MSHPKISQHIKEQSMREVVHNIKKKEEDLLKKEKVIKEKETDIEK